MISSGDFNVQNFQSLIDNYEAALRDVTGELDSVQAEHEAIKQVLTDNEQLNAQLSRVLAEKSKCDIEQTYKESDLIENLKQQLQVLVDEKSQAIKLWQNATETVEHLEAELKIYENNTEGFVPKSQLIQLKKSYEEKLNDLQATVIRTKTKLEETINLKSKELQIKDKKISGTLQSQDNTFKIIKNLEEEVLNLQRRLTEASESKRQLEKNFNVKAEETEILRIKVKECKAKVEEALQVVDAALNEKDAALLRETEAREETSKLSRTLADFIQETDDKIKRIQTGHDTRLEQMNQAIRMNQELVRVKEAELENYAKRCTHLEEEVEKLQQNRARLDDDGTSKMLILEKNFESTFQKLLLSEKQNIQLKAETEAIKNDLEQMSHYYQRDINNREAEKVVLKNEIKKLKLDLDQSHIKASQSGEVISELNEKISIYSAELLKSKNACQQTYSKHNELEIAHTQFVQELQQQLISQTEMNQKWRVETKNMTEQLERIITELKIANQKIKRDNKSLSERLREANLKMLEYRKFLEMISRDVMKITTITLPAAGEHIR